MKAKYFFLFVCFLVLSISNVLGADAENGAVLYKASKCATCHGKDGGGIKSQKAPKLAGQFDWYIVSQLEAFQSKKRKNEKMLPYIKGLSHDDFKDLAAYISAL